MSWLGDLLRRARLRGLKEGLVQVVRAEALDDDAKDDAERWQDYGFAGNPGDGQGLVINAGGHTIVLRMDRIAERPRLDALEVAVWHKEGHYVKLKAGRVVEVSCDELLINASTKVTVNTPSYEVNASAGVALNTPVVAASTLVTAPAAGIGTSLKVLGKEMGGHHHTDTQPGTGNSGPNA